MLQLATSDQWKELIAKYTTDQGLIDLTWEEIIRNYSNKSRYYHNLSHIDSLLKQANQFKDIIQDFDALLFAIWYHDIIYKATSKENELKSAQLMVDRLKHTQFELSRIEKCKQMILSTKTHLVPNNEIDIQYLLDFDLSILGESEETYQDYCQAIRREFKIYPTFMYNQGRRKALQKFLARERIYYTEVYFNQYETRARQNIEKEIRTL